MSDNKNLTKARDDRVLPAAREVLLKMAEMKDLPMGSSESIGNEEKLSKYYQKVYMDLIVPVILKHKLKMSDITFMFSVILQPFHLIKDVTDSSIEMNRDLADAKLYGMDDIAELTLNDIDRVLRQKSDKKADTVDKDSK